MSKLDEILEDMAFRCAGGITDNGEKEFMPAKSDIKALLLELVGEDETTNGAFADVNEVNEAQNQLRAELRKRVEEQ